jgi:hypothetical protein
MTEPKIATRVGAAMTRRRRPQPAPPGDGSTPGGTPGAAPAGGPGAAPGGAPERAPGTQPRLTRAAMLLRRHWLVSLFLAAGLVLRVLAKVAYSPALIYVDTLKYLYGVYPGSDPLGYRALLKVVLPFGGLPVVAVLQSLLGLAVAVVLYVVLLRRGTARWLAAVAVAPVLLDAYQLQMEQTIMPDVWFNALIVAGLAVLLWRPVVSLPFAVTAGLILGSSATFKAVGEILVVPAVMFLLVAGGGWRRAVGHSAALAAAFALPILGYCTYSYARTGHFWLAYSQSISGRLAGAADCATLKLPADVRPVCPPPSVQAEGPDWLVHSSASPLHDAVVPPGVTRTQLVAELNSAIEHQQPLRVVVSIAEDAIRLFSVTRTPSPWISPISRWQFQTRYPTYPKWVTLGRGNVIIVGLQRKPFGMFHLRPLNPAYGGPARVVRPIAAFLRSYQLDGGYTPGPLLLLFTLAGVAGSALVLIRYARGTRSRQLGLACLLFTVTGVVVLLVPDLFEFSWRYQLPALITLPPAGVLGISALLAARQERQQSRGGPAVGPQPQPAAEAPARDPAPDPG